MPKKKSMRPDKLMRTSMTLARTQADAILARRAKAKRTRKRAAISRAKALDVTAAQLKTTTATDAGLIVAEGDSWFDYPFYDVLKDLEDLYGYDVDSVAHRGDPIETMAYTGGQLDDFSRHVQRHIDAGESIRAILLSGGGNDIAGDAFYMMLNHAASGLPPMSDALLTAIIDQRLKAAYTHILSVITTLCEQQAGVRIPILLHAYDYPVPDGRGYLGGWGPLPGPWLKPGFDQKGYTDLLANTVLMRNLIDRLYAMIYTIAGTTGFEHVHVVDLRGLLSDDLSNYETAWGNELHPTEAGFQTVAAKFVQAIESLVTAIAIF